MTAASAERTWSRQRVIVMTLAAVAILARSAIFLFRDQSYFDSDQAVIGLMGNAGQTNYAASKAGLIGLTKSLARELASRNITANAVAPGFITTDMTAGLSDEVKNSIQSKIPLGKTGTPEDIANAVAFLASSEAGYITGQVLCVDGGIVM